MAEEAICESAGVNRGDVRQAFSRLRAEGLIVRGKRGGAFVREYTEKDLDETQEVRQIIETSAARLAIERAENDDFLAMEETARHMLLMAENGYILGVCESDLRFHSLLVDAAHNNRLSELYTRANIPLSGVNYIWKLKEQKREVFITDAYDHIQIVKYLREKNLEPILNLLTKGKQYG